MACEARQYSDQMQCGRCGLAWDMNDPDPPTCRRTIDRRAIPERRVSRQVEPLPAPVEPIPAKMAVIPLELPDALARDMGVSLWIKFDESGDAVAAMQAAYRVFLDNLP